MELHINTQNIEPVYEQIISQVSEAILKKELNPGDGLPSIRQLAKDLGINPNTVAKSFQKLEQYKLIISAGRKGTFIHQEALSNLNLLNNSQLESVLSKTINQGKALGFSNEQLKLKFNQLLERSI